MSQSCTQMMLHSSEESVQCYLSDLVCKVPARTRPALLQLLLCRVSTALHVGFCLLLFPA